MQVVRALFDGHNIKPIETIRTKNKTEVLIIFPNPEEEILSAEARRLLRGSGRGEKLTEKLLRPRADDLKYDTR